MVTTKRDGKQIVYTLSNPKIIEASDLLREVLISQHQGSDLASHLKLDMRQLVPLVHDPVCRMRVSPKTAGNSHAFNGQTYFFCASGCHKKFTENPGAYVHE